MSNSNFAFSKENYIWLGIGVALLIIGYLLMSGGGYPNEFHADQIFSSRRITLAPITVLSGYGTILYAILKKS